MKQHIKQALLTLIDHALDPECDPDIKKECWRNVYQNIKLPKKTLVPRDKDAKNNIIASMIASLSSANGMSTSSWTRLKRDDQQCGFTTISRQLEAAGFRTVDPDEASDVRTPAIPSPQYIEEDENDLDRGQIPWMEFLPDEFLQETIFDDRDKGGALFGVYELPEGKPWNERTPIHRRRSNYPRLRPIKAPAQNIPFNEIFNEWPFEGLPAFRCGNTLIVANKAKTQTYIVIQPTKPKPKPKTKEQPRVTKVNKTLEELGFKIANNRVYV